MLQNAGLEAGTPSEMWNITHPEEISRIHKEYIEAGSDIITLNTFGINTIKYSETEAWNLVSAAHACACRAIEDSGRTDVFKVLDIGPTGKLLKPYGDLDFEDAVKAFSFVISAGAKLGVDAVLIETMNDSYETKAAVLAAKENCELPIFVTNVYDESAKLMTGADIPAMVALLEGMGVSAIGINCSLGPSQMKDLYVSLKEYSSLPIIIQPNAGLPTDVNGKTVYDVDADEFASVMGEIARMGAAIIGGCCGTTPEYIRKMKSASEIYPYIYPEQKKHTLISSYTHAHEVGNQPTLIGERINPTGKSKLKEALRSKNMSYILSEAVKQEECGVHILDVNVGLPEVNECEMMVSAVKEIQSVSALPLQIDTVNPDAMEAAMRIYNGKPLVNSVNGSRESMEKIFPLVKKYGGAVIALTMDESGIPETAEGRLEIARRIVDNAGIYGINPWDIIVDPLALTVSSDAKGAETTLETIKLIKKELGVKTSLGISNISFGLPSRDFITSSFYIMALEAGLDCAIMNPYSAEMMKAYYTYRALHAQDNNFSEYIRFADSVNVETKQNNTAGNVKPDEAMKEHGRLGSAIIKGFREEAGNIAKEMLKSIDPMEIIDTQIIPALNFVGRGFEEKKVYLPGLLMSAEASQAAFEEVRAFMKRRSDVEQNENMSLNHNKKIVLATVKGDIHDIGKNIVRVLLENFGFDVIDLGRDVPKEEVCKAAKENNVKLVGLSALMTTTVPAMAETIELLHEECRDVKVVVGGAVLTQEYADMIKADKYAADAMDTVRYAQLILDNK